MALIDPLCPFGRVLPRWCVLLVPCAVPPSLGGSFTFTHTRTHDLPPTWLLPEEGEDTLLASSWPKFAQARPRLQPASGSRAVPCGPQCRAACDAAERAVPCCARCRALCSCAVSASVTCAERRRSRRRAMCCAVPCAAPCCAQRSASRSNVHGAVPRAAQRRARRRAVRGGEPCAVPCKVRIRAV